MIRKIVIKYGGTLAMERVKIRERSRAKTEINRGKREPKKERNKTR